MPSETIAYFSMEIALAPAIPTYAGGLGILAGDTVRSAADLGVPLVAVSLLYRKGYFRQQLDPAGWQQELPAQWNPAEHCEELPARVEVAIESRPVRVRAWRYRVRGVTGHEIAVILLDTDLPENSAWDRALTHCLYGGDAHYRLCQEVILGMGGVRALRALGYQTVRRFHMNEGHAALLALELLDERARQHGRASFNAEDIKAVQEQCVFTTHTPVPAGHDRYRLDHVGRVLSRGDFLSQPEVFCCEGELNLTHLALNLSHYVNGVARRHSEVSRQLLAPRNGNPAHPIDSITNGVHLATWATPEFAALFDRHIPGWREDNSSLRNSLRIPAGEIADAHAIAKAALIAEVNRRTRASFNPAVCTLGFARRATAYKRATLLLTDPARLRALATRAGRIQVVFAGKAHPQDDAGKRLIQQIVGMRRDLEPEVRMVYLEDYDWNLARVITAGVDVWLNTPQPPLEASGTSGMKAALNGVPSLSVLDGWWLEGCIEDVTGWAIGNHSDAGSLYEKLETAVLPRFYRERDEFLRIMRYAIALNASHFNTQRMLQEYVVKAYLE